MTKYTVDAAHSSIGFQAKHMMISKVKGHFDRFTADLDITPEDLTGGKISFEIELASINTNNEDRDNHLRSADFFDTENNPKMSFVATDIKKTDDDEYKITGDLTIGSKTNTAVFNAEYTVKEQTHGALKLSLSKRTVKLTVKTSVYHGMQHLKQVAYSLVKKLKFTLKSKQTLRKLTYIK